MGRQQLKLAQSRLPSIDFLASAVWFRLLASDRSIDRSIRKRSGRETIDRKPID
jgi:hypothetical protein